jgi:ADP-ribose pyrophosphatase
MSELVGIETVQDLTAESRCDQGFVTVRRLRLRHRYADGSFSKSYAYDVVERPGTDAVAVLLWSRDAESGRVLVALRHSVRPPVVLRRERRLPRPDPRQYQTLVEVCAGSLEAGDLGVAGTLKRAASEAHEEAGVHVRPEDGSELGGGYFPAPGTLSEKVYTTAFEVPGAAVVAPRCAAGPGDGSVVEADSWLEWRELGDAISACARGEIEDAKTEISLRRLASRLGFIPELRAWAADLPEPWCDQWRSVLQVQTDASEDRE